MKPPLFGIFTCGSVCAFITASCEMIPFSCSTYALTAYTSLSVSDFGAFVGIASARTVTLHVRNRRFAMVPFAARAGGGVSFVNVL